MQLNLKTSQLFVNVDDVWTRFSRYLWTQADDRSGFSQWGITLVLMGFLPGQGVFCASEWAKCIQFMIDMVSFAFV